MLAFRTETGIWKSVLSSMNTKHMKWKGLKGRCLLPQRNICWERTLISIFKLFGYEHGNRASSKTRIFCYSCNLSLTWLLAATAKQIPHGNIKLRNFFRHGSLLLFHHILRNFITNLLVCFWKNLQTVERKIQKYVIMFIFRKQ